MTRLGKKFNFKAFFTLVAVLTLSLVLAFSAACSKNNNNNSSSSSSSSSSEDKPSDEQSIANGDFEWYTDDVSATSPYHTSIRWTRYRSGSSPVQAPTSTGGYGIIDTSAFDKLDDKYKPSGDFNPGAATVAEGAKFLDENMNTEGSKILVIQNKTSDELGTAQYMTSSQKMTVPADATGVFSVYVNTKDVKATVGAKTGAFIKISGTVGSVSVDDLVIENIDTDGKWVRYIISVTPSATASTQLTISLGLGRGDDVNRSRFASGFAFFDNVAYTTVKTSEAPAANVVKNYYDTRDEGEISVDESGVITENVTERIVSLNFDKSYATKTVTDGNGTYNQVRTDRDPDGRFYPVSEAGEVGKDAYNRRQRRKNL